MTCERCGGSGVPVNPLIGEAIRSDAFAWEGRRTVWPMAALCKPCWWELALEDREARRAAT